MPTIDSASKIASLMQLQLAQSMLARKAGSKDASQATQARKGTAADAKFALADGAEVSSLVLAALRALDPKDPGSERRAFGIFLQATLASRLGFSEFNEPSLMQLAMEVQKRMEADVELNSEIIVAGRQLVELAKAK